MPTAAHRSNPFLAGINDEAFTLYGNPATAFDTLQTLHAQVLRVFAVTLLSALAAGSLGSLVALWREKTFQTLALTVLCLLFWPGACEAVRWMFSDGSWQAGSGAVFALTSNALRPAGWTSADAAGLPILPGSFVSSSIPDCPVAAGPEGAARPKASRNLTYWIIGSTTNAPQANIGGGTNRDASHDCCSSSD